MTKRLIDADELLEQMDTYLTNLEAAKVINSVVRGAEIVAFKGAIDMVKNMQTAQTEVTLRDIIDRVPLSQELIISYEPTPFRDMAENIRKQHADWLDLNVSFIDVSSIDGAICLTFLRRC